RSKQNRVVVFLEENFRSYDGIKRTMAELLSTIEGLQRCIVILAILRRCTNAPSSSTPHFPEIAALADAVKAMLAQKSSPPASVKAVEEICVLLWGSDDEIPPPPPPKTPTQQAPHTVSTIKLSIQKKGVSTEDANQKFLRRDGLEIESSHDFNEIKEVLQEDRSKGNQESRRRDAGNSGYKTKDNERRPGKQEKPKALVTLDGEGVDWTGHAEDELENFALMAYSNSGSDTEMSAKDKSRFGYGDQVHNGVLSYENEVFQSVFSSRLSDVEDSLVHDRFENVEGMHAVPPPMTGNYMPPGHIEKVDGFYVQ
ncbi:hypothetical protein Tco_0421602, partial [Tanacetum coccineum]